MPECQPSVCINKSGEGVSRGEKILKITTATKFPTKRELAITWLHYIGTGHSVDLLLRRGPPGHVDSFTHKNSLLTIITQYLM